MIADALAGHIVTDDPKFTRFGMDESRQIRPAAARHSDSGHLVTAA